MTYFNTSNNPRGGNIILGLVNGFDDGYNIKLRW